MLFSWNISYIFGGKEMKDFKISWGGGSGGLYESISGDYRKGFRRRLLYRKWSLERSSAVFPQPFFYGGAPKIIFYIRRNPCL